MEFTNFKSDSTFCSLAEGSNKNIKNAVRKSKSHLEEEILNKIHEEIRLHFEGKRLISNLHLIKYLKEIRKMNLKSYKLKFLGNKLKCSLSKIFKVNSRFERISNNDTEEIDPIKDLNITQDCIKMKQNEGPHQFIVPFENFSCSDESFKSNLLSNNNFISTLNSSKKVVDINDKELVINYNEVNSQDYNEINTNIDVLNSIIKTLDTVFDTNISLDNTFIAENERKFEVQCEATKQSSENLKQYSNEHKTAKTQNLDKTHQMFPPKINDKIEKFNKSVNLTQVSLNSEDFIPSSQNYGSKIIVDESYLKSTPDVMKMDISYSQESNKGIANTKTEEKIKCEDLAKKGKYFPNLNKQVDHNEHFAITNENTLTCKQDIIKNTFQKKINKIFLDISTNKLKWEEVDEKLEYIRKVHEEVTDSLSEQFEKMSIEEKKQRDQQWEEFCKSAPYTHGFTEGEIKEIDLVNMVQKNAKELEETSEYFKQMLGTDEVFKNYSSTVSSLVLPSDTDNANTVKNKNSVDDMEEYKRCFKEMCKEPGLRELIKNCNKKYKNCY